MPKQTVPVSVVIPAYNGGKYLKETIESVLCQTLIPAEIIVVNDGSTDDTEFVALRYGVKLISQVNKGISAARNVGILSSTHDWIALLDQDDIWEPSKMQEQWDLISNHQEIDIAFTDASSIVKGIAQSESRLNKVASYKLVDKSRIAEDMYIFDSASLLDQIKRANFLSPSSMLARKDVLIQAGLFDEKLERIEDRDFFLRLFKHNMVSVIEKCLIRYRLHKLNASKDYAKMLHGELELAEKVIRYPDFYHEGLVRFYSESMPSKYYHLGVILLEDHKYEEAYACFKKSLRQKIRVKPLVRLMQSYCRQLSRLPVVGCGR